MPRRHVGKVETRFHSFLTSTLDTEVNGEHHASATIHSGNGHPVPIQQDGGCAPELVLTRSGQEYHASARNGPKL